MALEFKKEDEPNIIDMEASTMENTNKFLIKEDSDTERWSPLAPQRKAPTPEPEPDKMSVASKSSVETLNNVFHQPRRESPKAEQPIFGGFEEYLNPNKTQRHESTTHRAPSMGGYSTDDAKSYRSGGSDGPNIFKPNPTTPPAPPWGARESFSHKPVNNTFRKKELLNELKGFQHRGYELQDSYNMSSRVEDLENEVRLGNKYFETMSWQHIVEQGFFSVVWGIERSTTKFNPLSLQLNGLYNSTISNREMISHEIALIVKKYIGEDGDAIPPEIKLGLILMGTIVFTHLSNHVTKNIADQITSPDGGGLNGLFQTFAPMLSSLMGGGAKAPQGNEGGVPQPTQSSNVGAKIPQPPKTSDDLNDIFSKLMPKGHQPPRQDRVLPHPQATRRPDPQTKEFVRQQSGVSDDSASEYSASTLTNEPKGRRGRKKRPKKTLDIF